jgi:pimeloyl-ACP methyl ester carboxylesterase
MAARIAWKPYMFDQALHMLLPGISNQSLIIWGENDRIVPISCPQRYQSLLPNSKFEKLANCGHLADMEQPEQLANMINTFLAQ